MGEIPAKATIAAFIAVVTKRKLSGILEEFVL